MITDKQVQEWLLKKLYDEEYKFIHPSENAVLCCGNDKQLGLPRFLFPIPINKVVDIAEYLGIVDWSKVPVDTPVRVWNNESTTKERRHFAGYENGYVLTWSHGGTSWSSPKHCVSEWDHAELVEL